MRREQSVSDEATPNGGPGPGRSKLVARAAGHRAQDRGGPGRLGCRPDDQPQNHPRARPRGARRFQEYRHRPYSRRPSPHSGGAFWHPAHPGHSRSRFLGGHRSRRHGAHPCRRRPCSRPRRDHRRGGGRWLGCRRVPRHDPGQSAAAYRGTAQRPAGPHRAAASSPSARPCWPGPALGNRTSREPRRVRALLTSLSPASAMSPRLMPPGPMESWPSRWWISKAGRSGSATAPPLVTSPSTAWVAELVQDQYGQQVAGQHERRGCGLAHASGHRTLIRCIATRVIIPLRGRGRHDVEGAGGAGK